MTDIKDPTNKFWSIFWMILKLIGITIVLILFVLAILITICKIKQRDTGEIHDVAGFQAVYQYEDLTEPDIKLGAWCIARNNDLAFGYVQPGDYILYTVPSEGSPAYEKRIAKVYTRKGDTVETSAGTFTDKEIKGRIVLTLNWLSNFYDKSIPPINKQ